MLAYIGLFVLLVGVVSTISGPASAPACNGATMSPSDTCVETTYTGNQVTGTQTFSYDQMLASQQSFYRTAPWIAVIGAVLTGACGWCEYRWRRKRARYRAART